MIRIPTAICLMALGVAACDSDNIDDLTSNPGIAIVDDQPDSAPESVVDNQTSDDDDSSDAEVEMTESETPEPETVAPADNSTDSSDDQQTTSDPVNNTPVTDNSDTDAESGGDETSNDSVVDNADSDDTDTPGGQSDAATDGDDAGGNAGSDADSNDATDGDASDNAGNDASNDANDGAANDGAANDGAADDEVTNDEADGDTGGQAVDDDSGSSTSDGGEVANDDAQAGDTTGGQPVDDDAGSSTADGGQTVEEDSPVFNDDAGDPTAGQEQPTSDDSGSEPTSNGGEFQSDNEGGAVIRSSSLGSVAPVNICTTASNQQNFSDTRVGDFILHNNAWRPFRAFPDYEWEQCIYTDMNGALAGWSYDWGPGISGINGNSRASGDYYVRSYPELIFGVKDEFRTSAPKSVTGLPVELAQLPNISIDYSFNGPQYGDPRTVDASNNPRFPNGATISGERNIAIESFLYNKDTAGECSEGIVTRNGGSNHTYEIMVWLDAGAERLPAGPSDFVTDLSIRGAPYKVYTKGSDPRYIAFVAQSPQNSGTIYWNDFVDWAKANAHRVKELFGARSNSVQILDDWCVANILVGTEIFRGAGNLDIYNWTITQSQ